MRKVIFMVIFGIGAGIVYAGMIKGKEWTANGYKFFTGWTLKDNKVHPMRVSLVDAKSGYRSSVISEKDGFFCLVGREEGNYMILVQPVEFKSYIYPSWISALATETQSQSLDPFEYLKSKGETLSWIRSSDGYVHSVSIGTETIWKGTDTIPAKGTETWRFVGPKNGSITIHTPQRIFFAR